MARIHILPILLLSLLSLVSASAPTFCKCTCFSNSTIIRLGPQPDDPSNNNPPPPPPKATTTITATTVSSSSSSSSPSSHDARSPNPNHPLSQSLHPGGPSKRAASSSCTQCNRAFCLQYNLPICKDAEEKDVTTTCFQRDSRKDKVIVWGFILGTAGLLGWAGVRRVLEKGQGQVFSGFGVGRGGGGAGGMGTSGGFMGGAGMGSGSGGSGGGLGGMGAAGGLFRRVFAGSQQGQQESGGGAGGPGQGAYSPLGGGEGR